MRCQKMGEPFGKLASVFGFTLPNDAYAPTKLPEFADVPLISFLVSLQFGFPIFQPGLGDMRIATSSMLVPKTTSHFNHTFPAREYYVRLAGKSGHMQAEAVAHTMNQPTDNQLRRSPLAPDAAHVSGAAFGGKRVHCRLLPNRGEFPNQPAEYP